MKNILTSLTIISTFVAFSASGQGQMGGNLANELIHNTGSKPFSISHVYLDGQDIATLFVSPGETMAFNNQIEPILGGGFYEANANQYFLINEGKSDIQMLHFGTNICFASLRADRVCWDQYGGLTTLVGLRPVLYLELYTNITITSDVKNPTISDSNLYIKLDGHGDTEYWVKIQFGRIVEMGECQKPTKPASPIQSPIPPSLESYRETSSKIDGFSIVLYPDGAPKYTEHGVSGKLTRLFLGNKDKKQFEVELAKKDFTDGFIETKPFGIIKAQDMVGYFSFFATESQVKKMKEFVASQP